MHFTWTVIAYLIVAAMLTLVLRWTSSMSLGSVIATAAVIALAIPVTEVVTKRRRRR